MYTSCLAYTASLWATLLYKLGDLHPPSPHLPKCQHLHVSLCVCVWPLCCVLWIGGIKRGSTPCLSPHHSLPHCKQHPPGSGTDEGSTPLTGEVRVAGLFVCPCVCPCVHVTCACTCESVYYACVLASCVFKVYVYLWEMERTRSVASVRPLTHYQQASPHRASAFFSLLSPGDFQTGPTHG